MKWTAHVEAEFNENMNIKIFATGMFVAALCMTVGCAQSIAIRPGVTGMVIDGTTGQPLSGAAVALEGPLKWGKGEYSTGKMTGHAKTTSGADGKFSIDPLMAWGFRSATAGDPSSLLTSRVTVEKQGYFSEKVLFSTDKAYDVGTITLKRRGSTSKPAN
jgi:hypothetical protein